MAIDRNPDTAWGIYPRWASRTAASLSSSSRSDSTAERLTFVLEQTHGGGHLIGRLRLSVTTAPLCRSRMAARCCPRESHAIIQTQAREAHGRGAGGAGDVLPAEQRSRRN